MKPNLLQRNQYAWVLITNTFLRESFMCYTEIIRLFQSALNVYKFCPVRYHLQKRVLQQHSGQFFHIKGCYKSFHRLTRWGTVTALMGA